MINYKLKHNLTGSNHWPTCPTVHLKGQPAQQNSTADLSIDQKEKAIQSWKNIAVLKVTAKHPNTPTPKFYIGFYNQSFMSYLNHPLNAPIEFGVRIGPDDVNIFVFNKDNAELTLELVTVTSEDDERYSDLILI